MRKHKNKSKQRIIFLVISLILLFSIFKIGKTFASTETFSLTNVVISEKTNTTEINSISFEKNVITNDITFHNVGDSATYKITILNNENETYTIKSITDDNKNEYITYEYSDYNGTVLNSKEEQNFEITAKYTKELMDMSKRNQDFSVTFSFICENSEGNIVKKEISIGSASSNSAGTSNPKTDDNIQVYFMTLIISVVILTIILKKKNTIKSSIERTSTKKYKTRKYKLFSLFLAFAILIPTLSKASENSHGIVFENTIKLMDKQIIIYEIDGNKNELIVKYNEIINNINVPEKNGYRLDGWYFENGEKFDINTPIIEDISIKAKYSIIEYPITYNYNGGAATNPSFYTVEDEFTLNNPQRIGYTFSGWTTNDRDALQTKVVIYKGSTGEKQFTANYSTNPDTKYTVIHSLMNLDGKTYTEKEREELHGATDTTVTPQTKVYNGFTAPAETEILINPDGSSILEYKYTRNKYTFAVENTNDIDSEHSTPNDEYYYGTTIKAIAIDKDGYNFKKWSNEETSYTTSFTLVKDTVINPIYEAIEYQISYDLDDGNVSENPITYTIESDDIILNNPTKTEHQFIGWTGTDLDSITKNVTIPKGSIGDRSYLAHYTINQYTLTATNVDSSSTPNGTYDYGTPITLTAANLEGYTFKNWSNNLTTKTINFNLIEDTVIKAFYTGNKYTIVFNANGGTGTMSNQQMTYGTSTKLKANTFTRTEYVFDHWNTKADGTGTSYENQESVSNLATSGTVNLYVIWKEKTVEQNDFIEYDISYTDMYSDKSYTNTNAWKILDFTDNGDGTYSDVRLISTGVPAILYYSYQSVNNEWWETDITKLNSFANTLNTTIPTGGKYRLYSDYSNYPALMASAGLYESEKFETIKYKYGESFETWGNEEDYVNRGYFKNITNNNITYNESTSNVVTGADLFKVGNAEVRILTLPETNKLLNKTKNEFWGIVNNTTGTKIFDVLNLPYKGSYWLASPYHYISDGDEKFMVGISRTNLNRYDNNNSKSYNQGIRPIITLKGNFQLVDENKDGTWEIKE